MRWQSVTQSRIWLNSINVKSNYMCEPEDELRPYDDDPSFEIVKAMKPQTVYAAPYPEYFDVERPRWSVRVPYTGNTYIFWKGFTTPASELVLDGWTIEVEHNRFKNIKRLVASHSNGAYTFKSVWQKEINEVEVIVKEVNLNGQYRRYIKAQDPAILDKNWHTDLDSISTADLLEVIAKRLENEIPVLEDAASEEDFEKEIKQTLIKYKDVA